MSNPILYCTVVGNLVYLIITRSDISYVVHVVSWFVISPIIVHWVIVLSILQYLRDTIFQSFLFSFTSSLKLCVYYDANHGSDLINHKFVTGFCIFFLAILLFLKRARNNLLFFNLQPRQNIMLWHLLPKKLSSYVGYLQIWEFRFLISLLYIMTTRVLFRLLTTQFFMNKLSTLRSIVILLVIISSITPLLCHMFLILYGL